MFKLGTGLMIAVLLAGCVTTPTGTQLSPAGQVALQEAAGIAVRRYLRDKPDAARRVANIKAIVVQLSAVTDEVTVEGLKQLAAAEITKRVSDPLDRADALSLLNIFAVLVQERVGTGVLDSQALVKVNEVLQLLVAALPSG